MLLTTHDSEGYAEESHVAEVERCLKESVHSEINKFHGINTATQNKPTDTAENEKQC